MWRGYIKKHRDILSVVLVLAIPRPLDYSRLFAACSAVSAMWALAWGLVCKELHMLELHFLFSVRPLSQCTEGINNVASEVISPSLHCCVLYAHVDTCLSSGQSLREMKCNLGYAFICIFLTRLLSNRIKKQFTANVMSSHVMLYLRFVQNTPVQWTSLPPLMTLPKAVDNLLVEYKVLPI